MLLLNAKQVILRGHEGSQGCTGCICTPGRWRKILGVIYRENL